MIKILHVLAALDGGGVECMLKNYYENFDCENIKFDFIVFEKGKGMLEEYFLSKGSKIFHITPKKENFIKSNLELKKIIKNGQYDIIHCHQNRSNIIPLYYAHKYKIKNRICHSHSASIIKSFKEKMIKNVFSYYIEKYATKLFACSNMAAKWLYSKKVQEKVTIINNAIELKRFEYNSKIRNNIREKYKLDNKIVVGCVARIHPQKNHKFLIDIFNELHKINSNYYLFLAGDGVDKELIENKVKEYGLQNDVLFAGNCNNVNELLQAFDIFALPTLFEGLGISLIESQVSGLLTITSKDVVPEETNVTKQIHYIPLEKTAKEWANEIELLYSKENERISYTDKIASQGFNIYNEANKLEKLYIDMVK